MRIQWYGHSCFLITTASGLRILTDPCDESTGYKLQGIRCDCVTVSHDHFDHAYTDAAVGSPAILKDGTDIKIGDVKVRTVKTFHDDKQGELRGENAVFCIEADGLRIVHMGDFGEKVLRRETAEEIGPVDILLCPVGGVFTVDADGALKVAEALCPKVFVPMHFMTEKLSFKLNGLDQFLNVAGKEWETVKPGGTAASYDKETLPEQKSILLLDYIKE